MNIIDNSSGINPKSGILVSVGIPTYNRPNGLRRTLECITGQTYKNLEIIVSDNCSPDPATEAIAREFMAKDNRIRYYRQDTNKGPHFNFLFVLEKANGPYFMWAADDDWWDSTFISKCVEVLSENPDVVLCSTWASLFNAQKEIVRNEYHEDIHTLNLPRIQRLRKVIRGVNQNTHYYGLRRISATRKINMQPFFGNDHVFMMQLSYFGSFVIIPEVLYSCHISGTGSSPEQIQQVLGIKSALVKISPSFSIMKSYLNEIIFTNSLSGNEKLLAIVYVVERYTTKPYIIEIIKDFLILPFKLKKLIH